MAETLTALLADLAAPPVPFDLAPTDLRPLRPVRFAGDGVGLPLDRFALTDQALIREVYRAVTRIRDAWRDARDEPTRRELIRTLDADRLLATARRLGWASHLAGLATPATEKILHDIRGGGLVLLIGVADLVASVSDPGPLLDSCGAAARDHATIMRSALTDLDPTERDTGEGAHAVEGFLEAWRAAAIQVGGRDVRVDLRATYRGGVAGLGLEAAAVGRVVYNLLNNAARFAADGRIALDVSRLPTGLVRWVVGNRLGADERRWLANRVGADMGRLYRGGMTHGGTGVGLSACADLVAASCGLASGAEAVGQGYLGAKVIGDRYYAWFHWPAYEGREEAAEDRPRAADAFGVPHPGRKTLADGRDVGGELALRWRTVMGGDCHSTAAEVFASARAGLGGFRLDDLAG